MERNHEHYLPLLSRSGEDGDVSPEIVPYKTNAQGPTSSTALYVTLAVSFVSILSAIFLHTATSPRTVVDISDPRFLASLRKVTPYPNLEHLNEVTKLKSVPKIWFPGYIARANSAEPDQLYSTSSSVTLSPTDSMFFRWRMENANNSRCYVTAVVPNATEALQGNKSYVAEGDVSAIEIWNVSYSAISAAMSWNTRPPRQSLLGTVNFSPVPQGYDPERAGIELRPPTPLFDCGGDSRIAIEVACNDCRLNFEQVFSSPPMAFDVWVLQ
ncbi:hypothetical protein BV22DRAFT_1031891 [Leucogyrophana mollusca]|uniref:Uncharacterized protein n=1 Tax=Leucogyrophana mollusca TaxID=85980 RepID=A0ACB8BPA1_9AGAM|nr:hypothetical protein BV22DRAFT_1031891 [Leucogyrophana mollusca]